ncbi:hypothetical protein CCACVL1_19120, partial [Corchorus capsularis]
GIEEFMTGINGFLACTPSPDIQGICNQYLLIDD